MSDELLEILRGCRPVDNSEELLRVGVDIRKDTLFLLEFTEYEK